MDGSAAAAVIVITIVALLVGLGCLRAAWIESADRERREREQLLKKARLRAQEQLQQDAVDRRLQLRRRAR